jgi:5-methylcytosine-specific restriction endonuclease McrA
MLTPESNATVVFKPALLGLARSMKGSAVFSFGSSYLTSGLTRAEFDGFLVQQRTTPVALGICGGRKYWAFRDAFYSESEGLTADAVYALIVAAEMEHQERLKRQIERAKSMVAQGPQDSPPQRGHISVEIRNYVFQRDSGRCVTCGSTVELQFDHIIPVKLGGSSQPENLQVLCGPCNRRKGATLG